MGKATGFLDYARQDDRIVPVSERILTFDEFHAPLDEKARTEQAGRCMNCGVPFCQSAMKLNGMVTGCPLHNLIPEWNCIRKAEQDQQFSGVHRKGVSGLVREGLHLRRTFGSCQRS